MKKKVLRNFIHFISIFVLGVLIILTPSLGQDIKGELFLPLKVDIDQYFGPINSLDGKKANFMLTMKFLSKEDDELLKQIFKCKDNDLLRGFIEIYQNDRLIEKRDLTNISSKMKLYFPPKVLDINFYFYLEQLDSVTVKGSFFIRESLVNKVNVRIYRPVFYQF